MFNVLNLAAAAYRAAAWRLASRRLPYLSDHMMRDIGFTRACVADGHRARTSIIPFGPFGLPIGF